MTAPARSHNHTATLEDYVDAVKRQWLIVVAIALGCAAVAFLLGSSGTPTYTATARVDVGPTPVGSIDGRLVVPNLSREAEVIISDRLVATVAEDLGLDTSDLSIRRPLAVQFVPEGAVLRLSYQASSAVAAASFVNAFAEAYVDDRLAQQSNYHSLATNTLQRQMADVNDELAVIGEQIDAIDAQRRFLLAGSVEAAEQAELTELAAERGVLLRQRETAAVKLQDLETALVEVSGVQLSQAPSAQLAQRASTPKLPDGIGTQVLVIFGLVFGAALGTAGALLVEYLETTAATRTEVEAVLGVPVLVSVPRLHRFRRSRTMPMASRSNLPRYRQAREAYLRLHIAVDRIASASGLRSIVITSPGRGEGKSSVTANLATASASRDVRTVAVSADIANPGIERWFKLDREPGLSNYLRGAEGELEISRIGDLSVVPAGSPSRSSGALLASPRFAEALELMYERHELVIVDTPATAVSSDALTAARQTDAVLLVVDARRTSLDELDEAKRELEFAGAKVVGAILNFVRPGRGQRSSVLRLLKRPTPRSQVVHDVE